MTDDGNQRRDGPTGGKPNWGLAFDLGLRLGISILIGLGGGLIVDNWLHTSPLFTLIGMVLAAATGFGVILEQLKRPVLSMLEVE